MANPELECCTVLTKKKKKRDWVSIHIRERIPFAAGRISGIKKKGEAHVWPRGSGEKTVVELKCLWGLWQWDEKMTFSLRGKWWGEHGTRIRKSSFCHLKCFVPCLVPVSHLHALRYMSSWETQRKCKFIMPRQAPKMKRVVIWANHSMSSHYITQRPLSATSCLVRD